MKTVEERLDRLEKSARRYRLATVFLALVIVAGVTMGQALLGGEPEPLLPSALEAMRTGNHEVLAERVSAQRAAKQQFNVIRAQEIQIATLTGQIVGIFGAHENRGVLVFLNRFGTILGFLGENDDGNGGLNIFNSEGTLMSQVTVNPSESGSVTVFNAEQKYVGVLGGNAFGDGSLEIYSGEEKLMGGLRVTEKGDGSLEIFNRNRVRIGVLSADTQGNGGATVMDGTGRVTWAASQATSHGLLGDLNNNGVVDFADFLIFAQQFGKRAAKTMGEATGSDDEIFNGISLSKINSTGETEAAFGGH